jgi:hypothetical protein
MSRPLFHKYYLCYEVNHFLSLAGKGFAKGSFPHLALTDDEIPFGAD